jgi:nonsense-mediated mRNA decay protein 3
MKDGKQMYRMTYLIRLHNFHKDDFFKIQNSYFIIKSIKGNKILCLDLTNWSEHVFESKDLLNIKTFEGKNLRKDMILISQSPTDIQLMDQKSYKTYDIKKPTKEILEKTSFSVIKIDDKFLLIPEKEKNKIGV